MKALSDFTLTSQVPVSNESPVFHGTNSEIGNGEHVLLWQWEAHVEITF